MSRDAVLGNWEVPAQQDRSIDALVLSHIMIRYYSRVVKEKKRAYKGYLDLFQVGVTIGVAESEWCMEYSVLWMSSITSHRSIASRDYHGGQIATDTYNRP